VRKEAFNGNSRASEHRCAGQDFGINMDDIEAHMGNQHTAIMNIVIGVANCNFSETRITQRRLLTERNQIFGPPEQYNGVVKQCVEYENEVAQSGGLLAVEALEPVNRAATVRVRSGTTTVTDGPFAETKEQLAGFFLIEAHDLNGAIKVAEGMPQARIGSIEIRPIKDLSRHLK
jgi:hypothetical protein